MTTPHSTAPSTLRLGNIWPYAIVAWFVIFISASVVFVAFAARHPMALVSQNYYEEELLYQQRLESLQRGGESGASVSYQESLDRLTFQLPPTNPATLAEGHIHLYRPSDARLDQSVPLALDATGAQHLDTSTLLPGLWKVRVHWKRSEQVYFLEQPLIKPAVSP